MGTFTGIKPIDGYEGLYWAIMRTHAKDYAKAWKSRDIGNMRKEECLMRAWVAAAEQDSKVVDSIISMIQRGINPVPNTTA